MITIPQEWIDDNSLFATSDHAQAALDRDYPGYKITAFDNGNAIVVNECLETVLTIKANNG